MKLKDSYKPIFGEDRTYSDFVDRGLRFNQTKLHVNTCFSKERSQASSDAGMGNAGGQED